MLVSTPAHIINLPAPGRPKELPKSFHQIKTMDVVANLLSLVAEHAIGLAQRGALHQVGQKSMQLGSGVRRSGKTTASKADGFHAEIAAVLLYEDIGRRFTRAEERVFALINAQPFVDPDMVWMSRLDFPARIL